MSTYSYLYLPSGNCVHFIDDCPEEEDLKDLVSTALERLVRLVYIDCAEYANRPWEIPNAIAYAAQTAHPPYDEDNEPNWVRWWDDMLSLGKQDDQRGLAIVLDNAHAVFDRDRKFITTLVESFLHSMKPW